MQHRKFTLTVLVALAVALPLAGCGGGEGGGEADGAEQAAVAETIRVTATEFAFEPVTVTVDAPGTYTFVVANEGKAPHALAIEGPGVDDKSATIEGGETAELTVEITEAGEYRIVCPVDGHADQGMKATLVAEGR